MAESSKKNRLILAGAAGFAAVVGIAAAYGYFRVTTVDSRVCATCHAEAMERVSRSGMHPLEYASCAECHTDPACETTTGRYAAGRKNLVARCEGCHADVPDRTEPSKRHIKLSHKIHVRQEGCVCTDCHRNVAHDPFPEGTNRPTKEACVACHEHEAEIDGEVNEKNCMRCHYVIPDVPGEPDEEDR